MLNDPVEIDGEIRAVLTELGGQLYRLWPCCASSGIPRMPIESDKKRDPHSFVAAKGRDRAGHATRACTHLWTPREMQPLVWPALPL